MGRVRTICAVALSICTCIAILAVIALCVLTYTDGADWMLCFYKCCTVGFIWGVIAVSIAKVYGDSSEYYTVDEFY